MPFDPSQPYEVVDAGPPPFNPDLPFETVEPIPEDSALARRLREAATGDDIYGGVRRDALIGRGEFARAPMAAPITTEEDILLRAQQPRAPQAPARRGFLPVVERVPQPREVVGIDLETNEPIYGDGAPVGPVRDTLNRFGRGAVGGTGRVIQGAARLLDLPSSGQEDRLRRAFGMEIPLNRNPVSRFVGDIGRTVESVTLDPLNTYIDPARDETVLAQGAEMAGNLAPVIASGGTAAPAVGALMMTEGGAREAEAAGRDVDRAVITNFAGGYGLNLLPGAIATRGNVLRRAATGVGTGAGINTLGDVALQLADTGEINRERTLQNLLIGGGVGLVSGAGAGPRIQLEATPRPRPRPSITRALTPEAALELELQGPPRPAEASARAIEAAIAQEAALRQSPEGLQLLNQQLDEQAAVAANARDVRNRAILREIETEQAALQPAPPEVTPAQLSAQAFEDAAAREDALRRSPEGLQLLREQLDEEAALAASRPLTPAQQSAAILEPALAEQERLRQSPEGLRALQRQLAEDALLAEQAPLGPLSPAQESALALDEGLTAQDRLLRSPEGARLLREQLELEARAAQPVPQQGELALEDTPTRPRRTRRSSRSAGFVSPELILDPRTRSVLSAGLGGAYGITQGDTPEERARNAILYGLGAGAVSLSPELLRRIRPPSQRRTASGPSAPPFEGVVEPLGRRYPVLEGVGEPVEQFQVRLPGDERGVTMTRDQLEAQGIPVPVDSPQIGLLGEANAPEIRNIEQDNLGQRPGTDEGGLPAEAGRGDSARQGEEVPPEAPVRPTGGPAKDPYQRPGVVENLLGIFNTAIKNISPEIYREMQRYELAAFKPASDGKRAIKAFLDPTKKLLTGPEYDELGIQLQNGRFDQARAIIEAKAATNPELAAQSLNALGGAEVAFARALEDARAVGIETGTGLDNYWARKVKAATKDDFMEAIGRSNPGPVDDALKAREESLGRRLTEDEEEAVIGQALRGAFSGVQGGIPSHFKVRKINDISDLAKYYERWDKSGLDYFDSIYRAIAEKQFFGPDAETGAIGGQLGEVAAKLYREGKLGAKKQSELKNLLQVRFGPGKRGGMKPLSALRNLVTLSYLGSPIDTITQLGDPIVSASTNGVWNTLKAAATANRLSLDDFGVTRIGQEFQSEAGLQKTIQNVFAITGMEKVVGKLQENNLNAALNDFEGAARAAPGSRRFERLRRELEPVFAEEFPQLVEDLRDGTLSDNVKLAVFNRLTESQPITLSEMPISYLRAPNGRILWALKTYTAKQFDLYRRRVAGDLALGARELRAGNIKNGASLIRDGLQKGAALTVALAAAGAAPDAIKDTLLGRPIDPDEYVVNNLLRLLGINRYTTFKFRDEGLRSAIMTTAAPPLGIVDSLSKDIVAAARGKLRGLQDVESLQYVPLVGDILYWNVGKGAEKTRRREQKKANQGSADSMRRQMMRERREELRR